MPACLPPRAPSTATHSSDWQWAAPTFKNYGGSQSFSGQKTTKCREEKSMHLMNDMIQGLNKHRCAPLRRADGRMDGRRKRNGTEERLRPADGRAECPSFLVPHTRTRDDGPCERIASASVRQILPGVLWIIQDRNSRRRRFTTELECPIFV